MRVDVVNVFFALLTLAANVAAVGILAAVMAGRAGWLRTQIGPHALSLATLVAAVATLGSLYYSEVANFVPCELCWYQRIAMYPLPVVLGIAAFRRDPGVRRYALPLAAVGAVIATYHYVIEWLPVQDALGCSLDVPCSVPWFREFGFVSLPYMALSGFVLVSVLLLVATAREDGG